MKVIHVLAFVFLAVFLIISGIVGLAGIVLSPVLATILNLLALAAGVLFLVSVGKCCHECHECDKCNCKNRFPENK